jgi:predicted aspartyl protease
MAFERGSQGGVILAVIVNGAGPFRFLLDTGSTHSMVSAEVAERAGAPIVARTVVQSSLGEIEQAVVRIDRFECGRLRLGVLFPSIANLAGMDGGLDGVIGQDVLASLRFSIDFARQRVGWGAEAGAAGAGAAFPLQARDGRFVISLPQRTDVLRLVPDSGAATLLLFGGGSRALPAMRAVPGSAELITVTGRRAVNQARVLELRVGPTRLTDVPAVVVNGPVPGTGGTDGLLPLHLFDRVTFDGPRRLLVLERSS